MSKHKQPRGLVESTTAQSAPAETPPAGNVAAPEVEVDLDISEGTEPGDRADIGPGESRVERVAPSAPVMPDVTPGSVSDMARKASVTVPANTSRGNGNDKIAPADITVPDGDPKSEPKRERFKVVKDARVFVLGRATVVRAGQILDATTHPLAALRQAGVIMTSVE